MQLPRYIYGRHKEVKGRCAKLARKVDSGKSYVDIILSMGMLETDDTDPRDYTEGTDGLLVLDGPSPVLTRGQCFHLYLPLDLIWAKRQNEKELIRPVFDESVKTAWGALFLTSHRCYFWINDDARRDAYMRAVCAHWAEIEAVGPRFTDGRNYGMKLLELPTMVQSAIFRIRSLTEEQNRYADWNALLHDLKNEYEQAK